MPMRMAVCTRVVVPLITRVAFTLYAGLAIASFFEAKKIFDKDAVEVDAESHSVKNPIRFCTYKSVKVSSDGSAEATNGDGGLDFDCMDATLVTNIVPVSAVLSLIAICLYVLMDFVVRCRAQCCNAMGGVSSGVAAGFGAALSILLFQSMWGFLTIAWICDFWEESYASVEWKRDGQAYKWVLPGNHHIIWSAGVAAALSCVLSAIDAAVLARTSRPTVGSGSSAPSPTSAAAAAVVTGGQKKPRWTLGRGQAGNKCKTGVRVDQPAAGDIEAPPHAPPQQETAQRAAEPGANPFLAAL